MIKGKLGVINRENRTVGALFPVEPTKHAMIFFRYKKDLVMKVIIIAIALLSTNLFASDRCITDGDCQKLHEPNQDSVCFNVLTGTDVFGDNTCAERCLQAWIGYKCDVYEGEVYGVCRPEDISTPNYDPNDPNICDNALRL